jgi:Holliday junction DNA helicase RuvA
LQIITLSNCKLAIFAAMIAFVKGEFVYKTPAVVHVEANGVGYELQISLNTYTAIQHMERGLLHTHLHVREDAQILFGFSDVAEKEIFLQLISVSGIGAATARMILSSMRPNDLVKAILERNVKILETIKGIGKKSAERMVLELRDKVGKNVVESNISSLINNTLEHEALNALISLGITRVAGEHAIKKVIKEEPGLTQVEDLIKKVLKTI